ncbi:hypothetical protein BHE74_00004932 [Ensete ventricosum]|nr:hypothetical protein BHE74_00004932 [Ensete ventricosum]RZR81205.1 hypothetical protein BHM03_00007393 [Ensete ventricosum]
MMAKERLVGVAAGHGAARLMGTVGKAASRAAVHGSRPPATQSVDVSMHIQEVEEDINKGKEEKQRKQQEIENEVDSQIKNPRGQRSTTSELYCPGDRQEGSEKQHSVLSLSRSLQRKQVLGEKKLRRPWIRRFLAPLPQLCPASLPRWELMRDSPHWE